jgi:hypothetical protein
MTNAQKNRAYFETADNQKTFWILKSISDSYGTSTSYILDELMSDEAEHLLDYLNGALRAETYIDMKQLELL